MSFHVPGDIPDLQSLHLEIRPVVLAGDFNVMPTELDVYKPERRVDDALFRPEVRLAFPPPSIAEFERLNRDELSFP